MIENAGKEKDPQRARQQLDLDLGVAQWRVPGVMDERRETATEGPAWWHGDEDASQAFLRSMGVKSDG